MSQKAYFILAIVAGVLALATYVLTPSVSERPDIPFTLATAFMATVAAIATLRATRRPPV